MRSRIAVRPAAIELVEDSLKLVAARDYHTDRNHSQIEKQSEVVEITVIKGILVVPLDLKRNPVLETIDFMRGRIQGRAVNENPGVEILGCPALGRKIAVDPGGYG